MKRPAWQDSGSEPDYRFTLANERTFLAWIRTGLAILAGGVLLDQFAVHTQPRALVTGVAVGLAVLAAAIAWLSYVRWKGNEIAMRHAAPLPGSIGIPVLAFALALVAIVLAIGLLFHRP